MSKSIKRSGVALGFSPFTGKVNAFTRWSEKDRGDGTAIITVSGKQYDVTDTFLFVMKQYQKWRRAETRRKKKESARG